MSASVTFCVITLHVEFGPYHSIFIQPDNALSIDTSIGIKA